ncbi:ACOX1 [Branchiostoma lanceolatum]|uniref:Acyl-coenzyme A oxidase n=3 Tax=Branchiostoma lanceolatum TaxID=7740 RepID=A0A8J9V9G1_BRALA|nr:ACOX1 [Branchiostoma lanceolatum]
MAQLVNPDLVRERSRASFDTGKLTAVLYGGPDEVTRKRRIEALALKDPDYTHEDLNYLCREDQYVAMLKKSLMAARKVRELGLSERDRDSYMDFLLDWRAGAVNLHRTMFTLTLQQQGNQEQRAKWLKLAEDFSILGSYLQTEMGHGTFLRGLETTATYDPSTQEFVLHSPTLTATKWWPGGLGLTVTHGVVMAQLYTQGQCMGPHMFILQLRSLDNHKPLPGIIIGDIGPKYGCNDGDNGFLRFHQVRIPRDNMLMRFAQVAEDGTYSMVLDPRLIYGTMVSMRVRLTEQSNFALARAVTIAVRYSCVRHQSELTPGEPEPQILEYQTQQYKLFPHLAAAYAFWFTVQTLQAHYEQVNSRLQEGDTSGLQEVHALSAGLKAFTSLAAHRGIDECRLACGGHGYSHASGLIYLLTSQAVIVTGEGEATVMLLQLARYLVKCYAKSQAGAKLPSTVSYLQTVQSAAVSGVTARDLNNFDVLTEAYQHRAARLVKDAAEGVRFKVVSEGQSESDAWNNSLVSLVKCAEAHSHFFVVKTFVEAVRRADVDDSARAALISLCQLYALHGICEQAGDFLQHGFLTGPDLPLARSQMCSLLSKVRSDAVPLVDAFDFHDQTLQSVLGRYDGRVYEHLYQWAKKSPLNKAQVHESYYRYLQPFLQQNRAKL